MGMGGPMGAMGGPMGHGFPGFFGLPHHPHHAPHHHHQGHHPHQQQPHHHQHPAGPHFGGIGGGVHHTSHAKPGDWYCLKCNELNFASRAACRSCQTPFQTNQPRVGVKSGDWLCVKCTDLNFASRTACRKCGVSREEATMVVQDGLDAVDPSSAVVTTNDVLAAGGAGDLGEIAEQ
jgi:ribosomal protein L40E